MSCHNGRSPVLAGGRHLALGKVPGQCHSAQEPLQSTGKTKGSWASSTVGSYFPLVGFVAG